LPETHTKRYQSLQPAMTFYQIICLVTLAFGNVYATGAIAQNQPLTENFSISRNVIITRVSDGDSLRSGKLRIRLFGIDAPEKKQQCTSANGTKWACGETAQKALEALVANAPYLQCDLIDTDRYGRAVMRCFAGKTDIGAALVRAGLALAYRQYSSIYSDDEDSAKTAKLGMWAGVFTEPWAWRRSQ
jgi:endonuclease YncB( thermonuclease family)